MSKKLKAEIERLKDLLDAAYDSHAGECVRCRMKWEALRESRGMTEHRPV